MSLIELFPENLEHISKRLRDKSDNPILMFLARGGAGNRWMRDERTGKFVLRDEYAENIPEALIEFCEHAGWHLVVFYVGAPPETDAERQSYTDKFPGLVTEISYRDLDRAFNKNRAMAMDASKVVSDRFISGDGASRLFSYKGVSFQDQIEGLIQSDMARLGSNFITLYRRFLSVFEATRPLIAMGGRLDVQPYVIAAARKAGVVTGNIKLGIGEEMLFPFAVRNQANEIASEYTPDVSLVWGERQRELITGRFPDFRGAIEVSGRTRNDNFVAVARDPIECKQKLGFRADTSIITYGANHRTFFGKNAGEENGVACLSPHSYKAGLSAIAHVASKRGNTAVIVKPHPSDDIEWIRSVCASHPAHVKMITNSDGFHNADVLTASEVFVSSVSSMFSEALLSNCVPISLWLDDVNYLYERRRRDVFDQMATTVEDLESLRNTVESYLEDKSLREFTVRSYMDQLSGFFGSYDGQNAKRAVALTLKHAFEARGWADQMSLLDGFVTS